MNTLCRIAVLISLISCATGEDEKKPTIDDLLPKIDNEWTRRDSGVLGGDRAWVNFDHKEHAGEVLAFATTKVPATMKASHSPIGQASIETFTHNGSAWRPGLKQQPISSIMRHRIVLFSIGTLNEPHEVEAIEYTYIYESDEKNPQTTMAHGYCVVMGETAMFLQHTSPKIISSDTAFTTLNGLLAKQFQLEGKTHSFQRVKVVKTNDLNYP